MDTRYGRLWRSDKDEGYLPTATLLIHIFQYNRQGYTQWKLERHMYTVHVAPPDTRGVSVSTEQLSTGSV